MAIRLRLLNGVLVPLVLLAPGADVLGQDQELATQTGIGSLDEHQVLSIPEKWTLQAVTQWNGYFYRLNEAGVSLDQSYATRELVAGSLAADSAWLDDDALRGQVLDLFVQLALPEKNESLQALRVMLTKRYADVQWLKQISPNEHLAARKLLLVSEDKQAVRETHAAWIQASEDWHEIEVRELRKVVFSDWRHADIAGTEHAKAAQAMVSFIQSRLTDRQWLKSEGFSGFQAWAYVNCLVTMSSSERRNELGKQLADVWSGEVDWLRTLNGEDVFHLQSGLGRLIDRDDTSYPHLALTWMESTDHPYEINGDYIPRLFAVIANIGEEHLTDGYVARVDKAKARMAEAVRNHHLSGEADWSGIRFSSMLNYLKLVTDSLSEKEASALCTRMTKYYIDEHLDELTTADALQSLRHLGGLRDTSVGESAVAMRTLIADKVLARELNNGEAITYQLVHSHRSLSGHASESVRSQLLAWSLDVAKNVGTWSAAQPSDGVRIAHELEAIIKREASEAKDHSSLIAHTNAVAYKSLLLDEVDWSKVPFDRMMTYLRHAMSTLTDEQRRGLDARLTEHYIANQDVFLSIPDRHGAGTYAPLADLVEGGPSQHELYARRQLQGGEWRTESINGVLLKINLRIKDDSPSLTKLRQDVLEHLKTNQQLDELTPADALQSLRHLGGLKDSSVSESAEVMRTLIADKVLARELGADDALTFQRVRSYRSLSVHASESVRAQVLAWALRSAAQVNTWSSAQPSDGVHIAYELETIIKREAGEGEDHSSLIAQTNAVAYKSLLLGDTDWSKVPFDRMMVYLRDVSVTLTDEQREVLDARLAKYYIDDESRFLSIPSHHGVGTYAPLSDLAEGGPSRYELYARRQLRGGEWKKQSFTGALLRSGPRITDDSASLKELRQAILEHLKRHEHLDELTPADALQSLRHLGGLRDTSVGDSAVAMRTLIADKVLARELNNGEAITYQLVHSHRSLSGHASETVRGQLLAWALDVAKNAGTWSAAQPSDGVRIAHELEAIIKREAGEGEDYSSLIAQTYAAASKPLLLGDTDWSKVPFDQMMNYLRHAMSTLTDEQRRGLDARLTEHYIADQDVFLSIPDRHGAGTYAPLADLVEGGPSQHELYARRQLQGGEWKTQSFYGALIRTEFRSKDDSASLKKLRQAILEHLIGHEELDEMDMRQATGCLRPLNILSQSSDLQSIADLKGRLADTVLRSKIKDSDSLEPSTIRYLVSLSENTSDEVGKEVFDWSIRVAKNYEEWQRKYPSDSLRIAMAISQIGRNYDRKTPDDGAIFDEMLVEAIVFDERSMPPKFSLHDRPSFHFGYPAFWNTPRSVANHLSSDAEALLRQRMLSHDYPLPMAVMTLVDAARRGEPGDLSSLMAYFEEKVSSSKEDKKAQWLMALAFAAEGSTSPTWSVLHGKHYLDEALTTAKSDDVKRAIVRWLVQGQAALGQPGLARGLLSKHKDLYQVHQDVLQLEDLHKQVAAAEKAHESWVRMQVDYEAGQRRQILQQRLEKALAQGNQPQVDRYQRMLEQFDR